MSQLKKEMLKKNEKFEDGVLRADACMEGIQLHAILNTERIKRICRRILSAYPLFGKKEIL